MPDGRVHTKRHKLQSPPKRKQRVAQPKQREVPQYLWARCRAVALGHDERLMCDRGWTELHGFLLASAFFRQATAS